MFAICGRAPLLLASRAASRTLAPTPALSRNILRLLPRTQPSIRYYARPPRSTRAHKSNKPSPPPTPPSVAAESNITQPATGDRLIDRVWAAGQLSQHDTPPAMSSAQRLLRPTLFTLLVVGGSLIYAYNWTAPAPSERLFPTVPLAFSTVATIMALNVGVFVAWRIPLPFTWRILNRYFVSVPAIPHAASMLGCAFSHQSFSHLGLNMVVLYCFGTNLCEQIGAGPFIGLYLSGGVLSSLASLAYNVVRQRFNVASLGASGAIATLVGIYAVVNPDAELYVIFLPFIMFKAKVLVTLLAMVETLGIVRGWTIVDHVAHLSGLGWGVVSGYALLAEYKRRLERKRKELEEKKWLGWW
ncbi:hypothetical protein BZA05DRAFT_398630 [Tricharina praecox]|uniref:uncharacterized protein n=1 Tax=Tricharina praecox TaxID=43433 RepID=UPI00221F8320|nr:uncharacterized protein BZA05DRAFT_398630 [Tricharina praecox]KAI5852005.1 hypothetical protein BZA05DRAFT_398630 [Tricharina praecox]